MHYAGKNSILGYIHPTHEKLKTHFGFSLAQFIKDLQAKAGKRPFSQREMATMTTMTTMAVATMMTMATMRKLEVI